MNQTTHIEHPPDICLLLRVHAEQRWLANKVAPILRQLEDSGAIAGEDLGAALAYLEVLWLEAGLRASETDAAFGKLEADTWDASQIVSEKARRYHAAVRRLRETVGRRVRRLTLPLEEPSPQEPANS
jgi:histidinol dehydrogenase